MTSTKTTPKGCIKTSSLSDREYKKLRRQAVDQVLQSKTQTIKDVAAEKNLSHTTLWGWVQEDAGPNQLKWLTQRSHEIRGQRISKSQEQQEGRLNHLTFPTSQVTVPAVPKNKPWDKKKAKGYVPAYLKPAVQALKKSKPLHWTKEQEAAAVKNVDPTPTMVKSITLPSALRKTLGPHVTINLSPDGKLVKYEVTGDVNVVVFTQTESTSNVTR